MYAWSRSLSVVLCVSVALWTVGCGETADNTEDVVTITTVEGDGPTADRIANNIIVTGTNIKTGDTVQFRNPTTGVAMNDGPTVILSQTVTEPDTITAGPTKTIV